MVRYGLILDVFDTKIGKKKQVRVILQAILLKLRIKKRDTDRKIVDI